MMSNENSFGEHLKKRRNALGIRQFELAEKLDISPNHLSSLETGKSKPGFDLLCRICATLDVTPDYLILGSMHSNNVEQNIIDKLKLCSSDTLEIVDGIINILIETERNHK